MGIEKERFVFTEGDQEGRIELQEKRVPVINVMERSNLPSRPEMRVEEISGKEAVREHLEPLRKKETPNILYGVPHAGELIPAEFYSRLTKEGQDTIILTDLGTPDIFRSNKIGSVESSISRFIVDPNRAPDFISDYKLEAGKPPGKILWKEGLRFGPMYKEGTAPSDEEIRKLAEQFYLPYYNKIMGAIGSLLDRKASPRERILVVDGHSFPVTENLKDYFEHYGIPDPEKLPMFILGDRDGQACDADIMDIFAESLKKQFDDLSSEQQELIKAQIKGEIIGRNEYLKGVHNVKFWGAREKGVNAIQVECNELAYIDRPSGEWKDFQYSKEKMSIIQSIIERTCLDVNRLLKARQ